MSKIVGTIQECDFCGETKIAQHALCNGNAYCSKQCFDWNKGARNAGWHPLDDLSLLDNIEAQNHAVACEYFKAMRKAV